ncbi:MAG: hypothetical protein O3A82_05785 [Verrucomicrobia bacterium]|nr:hypothetical protein [Verrucomicrobiota bacterium]MDA1046423.1 hypothetical protein [Verrucomicrobiota bacterium]
MLLTCRVRAIDGKLNDEIWKHATFLHLFDFLASTSDVEIKADRGAHSFGRIMLGASGTLFDA